MDADEPLTIFCSKYCDLDLFIFSVRSDIWFDDVDIEDIENAVGKKLRCDNEKIEKVDGENAVINGKNGQMHMGR